MQSTCHRGARPKGENHAFVPRRRGAGASVCRVSNIRRLQSDTAGYKNMESSPVFKDRGRARGNQETCDRRLCYLQTGFLQLDRSHSRRIAPREARHRQHSAPRSLIDPVMLDQVRATAELLSAEPAIMVVGPPLGAKDEPGTPFRFPSPFSRGVKSGSVRKGNFSKGRRSCFAGVAKHLPVQSTDPPDHGSPSPHGSLPSGARDHDPRRRHALAARAEVVHCSLCTW